MEKQIWLPWFLAGILIALSAGFLGADEDENEEKIKLSEVPKHVMDAAVKAVEGFKPTEAEKETRDGKIVYEIEGKANGEEYEITVSAEGKVLKVEKEDEEDDDDDDDE